MYIFLGVTERQNEKRSEIDKKSKFPFPLLTNPSSTSAYLETSIDSDLSTSKSKGFLFPQDQVEQRRYQFGIKLKREVPSTATCTVTSATSNVNEKLNSKYSNHRMESSLLEGQESSSSHSNCQNESTPSTSDNKQTKDLLSESKNEINGTGSSVLDSEKDKCLSGTNSKLGLFSSLVSYSDDSENSSTMSDPEMNETR